jgi:hypothetical protein
MESGWMEPKLVARRAGIPVKSVDNKRNSVLLGMVSYGSSKVVLVMCYGHHEFPLDGPQVYT